jgi:hypothetical protein
LKELAMTLEGSQSIRMFDLIDAVPALQYLEVTDAPLLAPEEDGITRDTFSSIGRLTTPHTNLRFLKLNVRLRSTEVVQNFAMKFPPLEELRIVFAHGYFAGSRRALVHQLVGLGFLKRFELRVLGNLHMVDVIEHSGDVHERLGGIELYSVNFSQCNFILGSSEYARRKRELHVRLLQACRGSTCQVNVTRWNFFGGQEMYKDFLAKRAFRTLRYFLKQHRLPIRLKRLPNND